MQLFKFDDTVFSIKGNALGFLNGITSNALDAPLNAFLNQHGRIIATVRQQKINDDEFLISVPAIAVENLLRHLERYVKLSRVTVSPSQQEAYLNLENGKTVWLLGTPPNSVSDEAFKLFRLNRQIPLMGIDYQADEFILNVHEFDYTSYTKGCFLGQEPVAKVHNRSKPSRKLVVVSQDQCPPEQRDKMSSIMKDPLDGKVKGFVFLNNKPE